MNCFKLVIFSLLLTLTLPQGVEARMSKRATMQQGEQQLEEASERKREFSKQGLVYKKEVYPLPLFGYSIEKGENWNVRFGNNNESDHALYRYSDGDYVRLDEDVYPEDYYIFISSKTFDAPTTLQTAKDDWQEYIRQPDQDNAFERSNLSYIRELAILREDEIEMLGKPALLVEFTYVLASTRWKGTTVLLPWGKQIYKIQYRRELEEEDRFYEDYQHLLDTIHFFSQENPPSSKPSNAFTDVPSSHRNARAIERLQELQIVQGYDDGGFKPGATINRAEFTKIVMGAIGDGYDGGNCFPDVTDQWFASFVCAAKAQGIIGGYPDGTFGPERVVTFAEAAKIIAGAFALEVDAGTSVWYEPFVRSLGHRKAIPTDIPAFDSSLTRAQMAEMIYRLHDAVEDKESRTYEDLSS